MSGGFEELECSGGKWSVALGNCVVVVGVERSLGRGAMEPLMGSDAGKSAEGA